MVLAIFCRGLMGLGGLVVAGTVLAFLLVKHVFFLTFASEAWPNKTTDGLFNVEDGMLLLVLVISADL